MFINMLYKIMFKSGTLFKEQKIHNFLYTYKSDTSKNKYTNLIIS